MQITEALAAAPYPGRAICVFRPTRGELSVMYLLTGRSASSQNRTLVGEGTAFFAVNLARDTDDPLRHYQAAVDEASFTIVGNGDHVTAIARALGAGEALTRALRELEPEPDPPIRTARIVAVVERTSETLFIGAARAVGDSDVDHLTLSARAVPTGTGVLIATYTGDPATPSVWATPTWIEVGETTTSELEETWANLSSSYRVAIAARELSSDTWALRAAGAKDSA